MIIQEKESYFRQRIAEYKFTQLADEVSDLLNTTHWDAHNLDWRMQCFQFYFEAYQTLPSDKLNLTKQEISDIIAFMKALAENPKY